MMRPYGRYSSYSSPDQIRRDRNADNRYKRLVAARAKGTHTRAEWLAIQDVFRECVICGVPQAHLYGNSLTKDHIVSVREGGCDCIANIQPVCRNCNSRKGVSEGDCRLDARADWVQAYLGRMKYGWS